MRTQRTMIASALALGLLSAAAPAQNELSCAAEALDGIVHDIAGPADSTWSSDRDRVWITHGRLRSAYRISNRRRVPHEDRSFASSDPDRDFQRVFAVEVDGTNDWLVTLCEEKLYVEDISDPRSPEILAELALGHGSTTETPEPWDEYEEEAVDLKLYGPDQRIFLLTTKRMIVVDATDAVNGNLAYEAEAVDLVVAPTGYLRTRSDLLFNSLKINLFDRFHVQRDQDGGTMAYVKALISGYGGGRPTTGPYMMLVGRLGQNGNYSAPTFAAAPMSGARFVYWNPLWDVPRGQAQSTQVKQDHTLNNLAVLEDGASRFTLLACGVKKQIQKIDVTDSYSPDGNGYVNGVSWDAEYCLDVDPSPTSTVYDDLFGVLADPLRPQRFFARSPSAFHAYDAAPEPDEHVTTIGEPFGSYAPVGGRRDMIYLRMARRAPPGSGNTQSNPWIEEWTQEEQRTPVESVWTLHTRVVDYPCKVVDVTEDKTPLELVDEYFNIYASDGAVAFGDSVYLPNWSGVVRCARDPDDPSLWRPLPDTFQPAEVVVGQDTLVKVTEHIDSGTVGGVDRLFTVHGKGDFLEFRLDANGNPLPASYYEVNPSLLPGWDYPDGFLWSNDLVFVDLGPNDKFVLTALSYFDVATPPDFTNQHALLAYEYEPTTGNWNHVVTAMGCINETVARKWSHSISVAHRGANSFAFVAHDQGFYSVDITGLTDPTPSMTVVSEVFGSGDCTNPSGWPIKALTHSEDRIFAMVNTGSGTLIRLYDWDTTTGAVTGQVGTDIDTFTTGGGQQIEPGEGTRARFHETGPNGEGDALFAADPWIIRMHWPASGGNADSMDFNGYYSGDYAGPLQDTRIHDFGDGPRAIVVKTNGAFAEIELD